MKKIITLSLISTALALTSAGLFISNKSADDVNAYARGTLPTTIDLNLVKDEDIRNYYSSVNNKNRDDLLIELKNVLSNGQVYYSYDNGGDDIWKAYEITDRDWDKSPVTKLENGDYDPVTNTIYNFQYKKTNVDPYVRALYNDRSLDNKVTAYANHTTGAYAINREHIWAKSHGFDNPTSSAGGDGGARGDLMHLWPGDAHVNSAYHNNWCFGNVDKTRTYKNSKTEIDENEQIAKYGYTGNNYYGYSLLLPDATVRVFEPQDSDKGDIARALFYMAARYNNLNGQDGNIDANNPYLVLDDSNDQSTGTSTWNQSYSYGLISDLLEWNKLDPVDEFEIKRNDVLYRNFTKNRNPFIDFPEWADIIWGEGVGKASPSTDPIHGGKEVVSVSLDKTEISAVKGTEVSVKAIATGFSGDETYTWEILNDDVASIDSYYDEAVVTLGDAGVTTLKCSVNEGSVYASKTIRVTSEGQVLLDKTEIDDEVGKDINVKATAVGFNGNEVYEWKVDDYAVANVVYNNDEATVTIKGAGTTSLTCYVSEYGYTGSKTITVKGNPKVELDKYFVTGRVGESDTIRAFSSGFSGKESYSFTIEDSSIATVSGKGDVGVVTFKASGETTLTCKVSEGDISKSVSASIKVNEAISLEFDKEEINAKAGTTVDITAITTGFSGKEDYEWIVDDEEIATVTNDGAFATISLENPGNTQLTCYVREGQNSIFKSINVTVKDAQDILYTKVLRSDQIGDGDEIAIVSTSDGFVANHLYSSRLVGKQVSYDENDNLIFDNNFLSFKLHSSNRANTYQLVDQNDNYFAWNLANKSYNITLDTVEENRGRDWQITVNDGIANFINCDDNMDTTNRSIRYASSNNYFAYYTPGTSYKNIAIYKKTNPTYQVRISGLSFDRVTKIPADSFMHKYYLGYKSGEQYYFLDGSRTSFNVTGNTIAYTLGEDTSSLANAYFTIEEIVGGYSIKSASNYYIGSNNSSAYIASSQTFSEEYTNTIKFDDKTYIQGLGGNCLKFNGTSTIKYYSTYSNYCDIFEINTDGKLVNVSKDVVKFANSVRANTPLLKCDASGTGSLIEWNDIKTQYNNLSAEDKLVLSKAKSNELGNILEQFLSQYDYLVFSKYGSVYYGDDFMNRAEYQGFAVNSFAKVNVISSNYIVMIIVSGVSLVAISSYIFIKRRKSI